MLLSPLAHPFHPLMGEDPNGIIYNNGIPALRFRSESEFLKSFSDETLDDAFPPTAQDAAELEAVEIFVDLMAALEILEQKEQATRLVHTGLKKRWEARREQVERPRTGMIHAHHVSSDLAVGDGSMQMLEHRMRVREQLKFEKSHSQQNAFVKFSVKKQIQQPRKHY